MPYRPAWDFHDGSLMMILANGMASSPAHCSLLLCRCSAEQLSVLSKHGSSKDATVEAKAVQGQIGRVGLPIGPLTYAMSYEAAEMGSHRPVARGSAESVRGLDLQNATPATQAAGTSPVRFEDRFHYDLLVLNKRSLLLFMAMQGRMVVWYFEYDDQGLEAAAQPARYGPPIYPKSPWQRIGNFAVPFKGPFEVFQQGGSWHFAAGGQAWSMPMVELKEDIVAHGTALMAHGSILDDLDTAFGPVDKRIVLTRSEQLATVRAVIEDRQNRRLFWLTDSEIIDAAAPAKRVPVPAAARGALTQPPADDPFAGVLPCWRLINASAH